MKRTIIFFSLLTILSIPHLYGNQNSEKIKNGINLLYSGKLEESIAIFDSINRTSLDSLTFNLFKSLAYESVNDEYRSTKYDSLLFLYSSYSIEIGEILRSKEKSNGEVYLYLGGAYGVRGLRKAMLGDTWGGIKDGRTAHHLLHKSLEYDSTLYDVYYGLGMYHFWKSKRAHLFIKYLGWLFRIKDESSLGINELHKAMEKGKYARFPSMRALFRVLIEENRYDELIELTKEYSKYFPDDVYYKWFLGIAYIKKENWQIALEIYNEIEKNLKSVDLRGIEADIECGYYKALCLYHLGKKDEAKELLRKILNIKDRVNKRLFFFEDYIECAEMLMEEMNNE